MLLSMGVLIYISFYFTEKGMKEKQRVKNNNVREKHQVLSSVGVQVWGPNLKPRHVPD